MVLKLLKAGID